MAFPLLHTLRCVLWISRSLGVGRATPKPGSFTKPASAQQFKDPREDLPIRFQIDQPACPRDRRVVRCTSSSGIPTNSRIESESPARQAISRSISMPSK
jgi:hypothetical protein